MKGVSCVNQLPSVKAVTSVHTAAQILPVGAKLNQFWNNWLHPPLLKLTYFDRVYNNLNWDQLGDLLHALIQKNVVENVKIQTSPAFFSLLLVQNPTSRDLF